MNTLYTIDVRLRRYCSNSVLFDYGFSFLAHGEQSVLYCFLMSIYVGGRLSILFVKQQKPPGTGGRGVGMGCMYSLRILTSARWSLGTGSGRHKHPFILSLDYHLGHFFGHQCRLLRSKVKLSFLVRTASSDLYLASMLTSRVPSDMLRLTSRCCQVS